MMIEEKSKYRRAMNALTGNWTKIASIAVVLLSYIQYSYKYGVCRAFDLPFTTVTIRLADFIPAAAMLCFLAFYVFDFYVILSPQQPQEVIPFSPLRVLCGTIIDFISLNMILNDEGKNTVLLLLVSVIPPVIIELLLRSRCLRRAKERMKANYRNRIANDTEEKLYYKHFVKPCLICIMAAILMIPLISTIVTKNRDVYEICTIGEDTYAVIFNNSNDYVVLEPALVEGDSLTIYTGSYKNTMKAYVDEFSFRQFDHVTITDGKDAGGSGKTEDNDPSGTEKGN